MRRRPVSAIIQPTTSTKQTAVNGVEEISTGGKDRTKRVVGASQRRAEV
jgi:hypothetical protein